MGKYNHFKPNNIVNCNSVTVELPYVLITGDGNVVPFALLCIFVIHQATQNLNYGPVLQSQGHQSMSIGTAPFTLVSCFGISQSGWVFHKTWFGVSQ